MLHRTGLCLIGTQRQPDPCDRTSETGNDRSLRSSHAERDAQGEIKTLRSLRRVGLRRFKPKKTVNRNGARSPEIHRRELTEKDKTVILVNAMSRCLSKNLNKTYSCVGITNPNGGEAVIERCFEK